MTDCPHPGTGTGTVRQPPPGWARRLPGYCLRHRTDLLMAFGAAVTAAVATATLPLVLRHVVDGVAAGTTASLAPWTGLLAALGALRFGANSPASKRAPATCSPPGCASSASPAATTTRSRRSPRSCSPPAAPTGGCGTPSGRPAPARPSTT